MALHEGAVPDAGPAAPAVAAHPAPAQYDDYLRHTRGLKSWIFTLDHKRIGVLYLIGIGISMVLGGIFAMLIRAEHLTPGETIMNASLYNQVYTLHGAIMIFLVIIPGIPAALGNFALPIMLGAKDVAFPRLNLCSYYLYVIGLVCLLVSMVTGAIDTGWTFYTPYSTSTPTNVIAATLGAFILGFSSIFTGLNFIVTIHKLRPPGMTWFRMPLFLWGIYGTAVIQILATPVLGITLLLLIAERVMHIGIFDPALGGDPVLYQHFFWFYSHPAVYIMILPALAVVSEMIATFSHRSLFGYKAIAFSSIAIALLSFLVWGHHMFTSTQSAEMSTIFSFITFFIAIPTAIKVFSWLATLYKGSITFETPMIHTLSFVFIFAIGGLTGLFLSTMSTDVHLHDTYFVVAHFHYVMAGTIIAFFGALHYWWPKITGKMYNEFWGRIAAIGFFIGFNVTFLPQFIMGSRGMPRRYWDFVPEYEGFHAISSIGAFIMGASFVLMAIYLTHSVIKGRKAPKNPWGGSTLEWRADSPPRYDNFKDTPAVKDVYDYSHVVYDAKNKTYTFTDELEVSETKLRHQAEHKD